MIIVITGLLLAPGDRNSGSAAGMGRPGQVETAASTTTGAPSPGAAKQVTFSCTGSAPGGVEIAYGPDSLTFSATALPFTKTLDLDAKARYYVTSAQLEAAGKVTCQTKVAYADSSGKVKTVTKTESAQGASSILSAQVCSKPKGGWDTC